MATAGSKGSKEGMYCKIGQDTEWWIIMLQLVSYDGYVILGASGCLGESAEEIHQSVTWILGL